MCSPGTTTREPVSAANLATMCDTSPGATRSAMELRVSPLLTMYS
jgi:hypothetical protein